MVNKFQKRPTELFLPVTTSDYEERDGRGKSSTNARLPTPTTTRASSIERKFKLIRKKSSKEKDNLLKGITSNNTTKAENVSSQQNNKTTSKKNKITNKSFTIGKLFDAVIDNDFTLTRKCLIIDEMDVNEHSPEGTTVLHFASAAGNLDCLGLLLECGAKVNSVDINGRTPLEYANLYGNFECAAMLIEFGADSRVIKNGIH